MKKLTATLILALSLTFLGCEATIPTGEGAVYQYRKTADTCEVSIESDRTVPQLNAGIDKNCAVFIEAGGLYGEGIDLEGTTEMPPLLDLMW